ncbi:MAG: energy-coupling factor transporter transmembrane protein EcfT [Synergistaceae bacterium]|jgi:energy-coupling factor transport system permease protein|nr:energy-coupling factor transporter transmembrane protein EcfT [Synergistaceae bacterium]
MNGFLSYVNGSSPLHKLHPLTKMVMSFALCASCFLSGNHVLILCVIGLNLCLFASAGGIARAVSTLLSFVKFSAVLFVLQLFFIKDGTPIFTLPLGITLTYEGVMFSLLFVLRFLASTMPLALMLSVTPVGDISNVLVRNLRVPYRYAFVITTAARFIPLFSEEMSGIMEAQTARGVEFDTRNFIKKIRLLIPLCVPLLISSVRRIENSAISAELRGFNLRTRLSGYKRYSFGANDATILIACAALVAVSASGIWP